MNVKNVTDMYFLHLACSNVNRPAVRGHWADPRLVL
jgi:hypothetical protein